MAITRSKKESQIQELQSDLGGAESVILVDFKGLDVPQATELRRQVRGVEARFRVVKNRLARRAVQDTPFEVLAERFEGTNRGRVRPRRPGGAGQDPRRGSRRRRPR